MSTINESKLNTINELMKGFTTLISLATNESTQTSAINDFIKDFTNLISLATDEQTKPIIQNKPNETEETSKIKKKGYIVTTKREKCNGAIFKGYSYHVEITDGKNTAAFLNDGRTFIELKDFVDGTNEYQSRFWASHDYPGVLHFMRNFGTKNNEIKKQKENMLEFVKSCLDIPICFADGQLTYSV